MDELEKVKINCSLNTSQVMTHTPYQIFNAAEISAEKCRSNHHIYRSKKYPGRENCKLFMPVCILAKVT